MAQGAEETGRPDLSAVLVTWNCAAALPACLAQLRAQHVPGLELVVVDNGSVDGSPDLVEQDWPGARVIRLAFNSGFAAAANRGVAESTGSAVAMLNYDLELDDGYLAACLNALSSGPSVGSVQGVLLRPGRRVLDSAGHQVSRGRWFRNRGEDRDVAVPVEAAWAPAQTFGVTAAAAVYRRAMLDDVAAVTGHLFDEAFFAYLEDCDLDWRARWRGWEALVVDATAVHEHSGSGARWKPAIQRHIIKNRLLLLYRNQDVAGLLIDLPWIAAQMLARWGKALFTCPSALLGIVDAVRLVPTERASRRAIAQSRRVSPAAMRRWFTVGAA